MNRLDRHDHIAIDFDGTLVDTYRDIAAAINKTMSKMGLAELDEEEIFSYIGTGTPELLSKAAKRDDDEFLEKVIFRWFTTSKR